MLPRVCSLSAHPWEKCCLLNPLRLWRSPLCLAWAHLFSSFLIKSYWSSQNIRTWISPLYKRLSWTQFLKRICTFYLRTLLHYGHASQRSSVLDVWKTLGDGAASRLCGNLLLWVSGGSLQILLTWKDSEKGGGFSFNSTRPLAPLTGTSLPSSVISFIVRESHISFFLFSLSTTVFLLLLPNWRYRVAKEHVF